MTGQAVPRRRSSARALRVRSQQASPRQSAPPDRRRRSASGTRRRTARPRRFHAARSAATARRGASDAESDSAFLSLTALGVVYGDIGTSPLYALQQCFTARSTRFAPTTANVYGVLSLIVWLLVLVVAVKYLVFIMRADNRGEGGILALLALILQQERRIADSRRRIVLVALGLFGAALLYGDGMITPAISVLGASKA